MNHNKLNKKIYPIYGEYKKTLGSVHPAVSLSFWSKIGKFIDQYLTENPKLTKSKLFRDMYGKSEGSDGNIDVRGYIAREFLSRAHRVHLMEVNDNLDIINDLHSIESISPFREAMPFFDNKNYMFKGKKKTDLLNLLNSKNNSSFIVKEVRLLQKKYIKKSNSRTQRLNDIKLEVKTYIDSYNSIYKDLKEKKYKPYINEESSNISLLSSYLQCLTTEQFDIPSKKMVSFKNENLNNIKNIIEFLFEHKHAKVRRRFRRVVPVARIRQLSEYIYSLRDQSSFDSMHNSL